MPAGRPDDTALVRRATGGDSDAFGLLFDRWFDRAYDVAWHVVHDRDAAADVVQDTFTTAWRRIGDLRQPESFGGWLLRISRNTALDRLRRDRRSKPVGPGEELVTVDARTAADAGRDLDRREQQELVWAASAALGEEDASLLHLHLRHDMGATELADELGVKPNAAHQRLFRLKRRLAEAMGAWVLWRRGEPDCPELEAALARAEATSFDRTSARMIVRHARGCDSCEERRALRLRPETLFSAAPLVLAEPMLRARVAAALTEESVPVDHHAGGDADRDSDGGGDADDGSGGSDGAASPEDVPVAHGARRGSRGRRAAAIGSAVVIAGAAVVAVLADRAGDGTVATAGRAPAETGAAGEGSTTDDSAAQDSAPDGGGRADQPDDPVVPSTTADPTSGRNGEDAGSTATTTAPSTASTTGSSTSAPPVPEPEILRFVTRAGTGPCEPPTVPVELAWVSDGGSTATLGHAQGAAEPVELSGTAARCGVPDSEWTLTVTGDGGSVSRTTRVPEPEPPDPDGPVIQSRR